jgi:hypothetical protein
VSARHNSPIAIRCLVRRQRRDSLKKQAIRVTRRIRATDVIDTFAELMVTHGVHRQIRSDNSPEMAPKYQRCAIVSMMLTDL